MRYKELEEPCKGLIERGLCLGCNKLELEDFVADPNCEHAKERSEKYEKMYKL